jgi:hypothetical protein
MSRIAVGGANEQSAVGAERNLVVAARDAPLTNILIAGFVDIDDDGHRAFHAMMDCVYIKIGSLQFSLCSSQQNSSLVVRSDAEIKCEFEIDEDDEFCVCSVMQLFLSAPYSDSRIQRFDWFRSASCEIPVLTAMGLSLDRGEYLFFDPMNYFGIQIGGVDRREVWLSQNVDMGIVVTAEYPSG